MEINFTKKELDDLYDMLYILESGELRINKLDKSWKSIMKKIELIVVPELGRES